jgi:hypothetical protein
MNVWKMLLDQVRLRLKFQSFSGLFVTLVNIDRCWNDLSGPTCSNHFASKGIWNRVYVQKNSTKHFKIWTMFTLEVLTLLWAEPMRRTNLTSTLAIVWISLSRVTRSGLVRHFWVSKPQWDRGREETSNGTKIVSLLFIVSYYLLPSFVLMIYSCAVFHQKYSGQGVVASHEKG